MAILAVQNPTYKPSMRVISAITNANPAAVTTTFAHGYITGTICRLFIPEGYGILQANTLFGPITVTGSTTFTIDIDTSTFDPYTTPAVYPEDRQYAQVVPIGQINSILGASVQNVLPY